MDKPVTVPASELSQAEQRVEAEKFAWESHAILLNLIERRLLARNWRSAKRWYRDWKAFAPDSGLREKAR